jgi:RHS repeat-associated protein
MHVGLGLRIVLCAGVIGLTMPAQLEARQLTHAIAASMPAVSPAGGSGSLLSAFAQQSNQANELPQAYIGAIAQQHALFWQIAETAVPAFRGANGPGGAVTALTISTLLGRHGITPDPLTQERARVAALLGPLAAPLGVSAATSAGGSQSPLAYTLGLVDPASGSLHLTYQDLSIPARGHALELQRTFAPQRQVNTAMGAGWAFSYGIHLTYDPTGQPAIQEGSGALTHFEAWDVPGTYLAIDVPVREVLALHGDGSATRTLVDGSSEQFDKQGRLASLRERDGYGLTLTYAGVNLVRVADAAGRTLRFAYDRAGLIRSVTDPTGAVLRYTHDNAGNLTSAANAEGRITRFAYTRPAVGSYDVPLLTRVTLPRGGTIRLDYDAGARVVRLAGPGPLSTSISYTSDPVTGQKRTDFTDATGAHTEIDTLAPLASAARCASSTTTQAAATPACPSGVALALTRVVDPTGRASTAVSGATGTSIRDAAGHVTQVMRDTTGRPEMIQSSGSGAMYLRYDDATSAVTSLTDAVGHTTTFSYDAAGHLRAIRDGTGAVTQIQQPAPDTYRVISPGGHAGTLQFDAAGNITSLVDALGRRTHFTWDADGRLLSVDDPVHGRLTYGYDAAGALIARTDSGGATTRYGYDGDGNPTFVRDTFGNAWRFTYDQRDLPVTVTDPLGLITRISYDAAGRETALTDPLGHSTRMHYDASGQLLTVTDPRGAVTRYNYGSAGELVTATTPAGHTTRLRYDASGHAIASIDPNRGKTTWTYNAAGRLVASHRPDGVTATYKFDGSGRLLSSAVPDGSGATYARDADGNLVRATGTLGTIRDYYDAAGDLLKTVDSAGHVVRYTYDGSGRRSTMVSPSGAVTRYRYDVLGHIVRIDDPLGSSSFSYDALGRRTGATLPAGLLVRYGYDPAGRPTSIVYRRGSSIVADFAYQYDSAGNLVSERANGHTQKYRYDAANRLVQVSAEGRTMARYTYDADGNLISSPAGVLRYDANGRLVTASGHSQTYDAAGNLTTSGSGTRYQFDQSGRLMSASGRHGKFTYGIDALGRTVTRSTGGKTTDTVYDGSDPIAAYGPKKAMTRTLYGPLIDEPLASTTDGRTYVYIRDRLGNVREVLDGAGKVAATLEYDAYGRLTTRHGNAAIQLGYSGRPTDPTSGLVNLRQRLYDPALGRFLSPDPIALPGNSGYVYVADNPLTFKDPLGLDIAGVSNDDIGWGGNVAGAIGGGASIIGAGGLGTPSAGLGSLGNVLGDVAAAAAIANAINNPSQSNAANAGIASAGAVIGHAFPGLPPAAVAGLFIAGTYAQAAQSFIDAANALSTPGEAGAESGNGSGGGSWGGKVGNTDPTFIDTSAVGEPSPGGPTGSAPLTLVHGAPSGALAIPLALSAPGALTATVYDALGRSVRVLAASRQVMPPATDVSWDGGDGAGHAIAPGRYYALADLAPTSNPSRDILTVRSIDVVASSHVELPAPAASHLVSQLSAHIVVPQDGALIEGSVPINGDAGGTDFDHYVVDYGSGTTPTTWTELSSDTHKASPRGPISVARVHTLSGNLANLNTGLTTYFYNASYASRPDVDGLLTLRLRVFGHRGEVVEARTHVLVGRAVPYTTDSLVGSPDGGAQLTIPSLSLHSYVQLFAIEPVMSAPAVPAGLMQLGKVYAVHPAGYSFSTPVTLHLAVPRSAANAAIYTWAAAAGQWQRVPAQRSLDRRELVSSLTSIAAAPALYTVLQGVGRPAPPILFASASSTTALQIFTLAGAASPGAEVAAVVNGKVAGTVTADANGLFMAAGLSLRPGANALQAVAYDAAGHAGVPSSMLHLGFKAVTVSIASLRVSNDTFTAPAPSILSPGDRIGVEVRIGRLAHEPDGFTIHVTSGVRPRGFDLPMRRISGLIYRAVLAVGASAPPDLSPRQSQVLGPTPVLAAFGGGDIIHVSAGSTGATARYRDTTGPIAPAITSSSHTAAIASSFARPDGIWPSDPAPLGAVLDRVALPGKAGTWALRATAGPTGELIARIPVGPFDLAAHPIMSFSYNVPANVSVDLAIHVNGFWHVLGLSDLPPMAYDQHQYFFTPFGSNPVKFIRDGRWRRASLNLYQAVRAEVPTGPINADQILFGNWASVSWMAVEPSHVNAPGSSFMLGDVTLPAATRQPFVRFSWSDTDPSGIAAYSYTLDQQPATIPGAHSMGRSTQARFGPLTSGVWWLHVRAVDGAGNWGTTAHYPVIVDMLPPIALAPNPGPGQTGDAYVRIALPDLGASGVDVSTLRFSAFGHSYGPESGAISYNNLDNIATFDLGRLNPTPPLLYPGGRVPVALVAVADAAGNRLAHPLAWTYTLDIPNSLPGGPQLLTTRGGDAPSFSPDSTRVVFVSKRQGGSHLWTIDAGDVGERRGTARILVSGAGADADPSWSPDGKSIVFSSTRAGGTHLWQVTPSGGGLHQLTSGPQDDTHPTWSPDGKMIAFVRGGDLWKVDAGGQHPVPVLVDGDHAVREPSWSLDGKLIAFRHSLYVDQIWTVHPDGTKAGPGTSLGQGEAQSSPTWQANGTIAYISRRAKVVVVYSVYPDRSGQRPLIGQPPALLFSPVGSRDGSVFGFASTLAGNHNVWVSRDFRISPFDTSTSAFDAAAGRKVTLAYGTSSVAKISLTVVDANGQTVRTFVRDQRIPLGQRSVTWDGRDDRGRFLPEGAYSFTIVAQAPGLAPLQRGAGVLIDDVSRHGVLQVDVTVHGQAAVGASVTVSRAGTSTYVGDEATNHSGVAIFDLAPGRYDVTAISRDGAHGAAQGITIATGVRRDVAIALLPAPITGVASATPAPPTSTTLASPSPTGAAAASSTPTSTPAASTIASATATTRGQGTLAVTVLGSPGHPLAGASVKVNAGKQYVTTGYTGSDGEVTFSLKAGTYQVQVLLGNASTSPITVQVVAGATTRHTITLGPGTLAVTVLLAPAQIAVGAGVEVDARSTRLTTSYTDSTGATTFTLNAGTYTLHTTLGSAVGPVIQVTVTPGSVTKQTVILNAGTLVVTTLLAPGHVAESAGVEVDAGSTRLITSYSDSTGATTFILNTGIYTLHTTLGTATGPIVSVTVTAGGVTKRTVVLNAGTLVVTTLLAPGHVAEGAGVEVDAGGASLTTSYTDSTGKTKFTLNAGTYTLHTTLGDAKGPVVTVRVTAGGTTNQTVVLNAGTLAVLVLTASGKPADGASVEVDAGSANLDTKYTDSAGSAPFILNAGTYRIRASKGNTTSTFTTVRVGAGGTSTYTIRL